MTRSVTILGATGSIGRSTADVLLAHRDQFRVEAVVGGSDPAALAVVARRLGARFAALADEGGGRALAAELSGSGIASGSGPDAVLEAARRESDIVVAAISGTAGLRPTYAALAPGRCVALANKESLVCAGEAFMAEVKRLGVHLMPMDSEHNALHQALGAGRIDDVAALVVTASGGPFRTWPAERIAQALPKDTAHPIWPMGAKINVDSASLMNKGLELIEAFHLFGVPAERLEVVVHPQSIIHGLVQWRDGSVTAGLGVTDMRIPIANCLSGAEPRLDLPAHKLDLVKVGSLTFEAPDLERFPCLGLARAALAEGGAIPAVLNAANEVAVAAFLAGRIGFGAIAEVVETTCAGWAERQSAPFSVEEALTIDEESRRLTTQLLPAAAQA